MMLELHNLKNVIGAKKNRKRVGRGNSSGKGGTCGRGENGQKSRSGSKIRLHFEGGQSTIFKRIPYKKGAKNKTNTKKKFYTIVNLKKINDTFKEGETIDKLSLFKHRIISNPTYRVKILGIGDLDKFFIIIADAFSNSAIKKIESIKGEYKIL